MEEDVGVIQSGIGPYPIARLSHTRSDNGGLHGNLVRRTTPEGEYPHVNDACPCRRLCTYRGGVGLGGAETMGAHVGMALLEVRQSSLGVATGLSISESNRDSSGVRSSGEDDV